jgi:cell division protein FtsQ
MAGVKSIALYMQQDSFWMAQVDQVDINEERQFVLWPKVGDHEILFGDGQEAAEKFHRLSLFYQQVLTPGGFNAYSLIDVRFNGQIVAVPNTQKYARRDTALLRQWYQQWQSTTQHMASQKPVSTQPEAKKEEKDHSSLQAVPNPMKPKASTTNPVPGKQKDSGIKGALPAEKTGPKAVMPPSVKTS